MGLRWAMLSGALDAKLAFKFGQRTQHLKHQEPLGVLVSIA